MGLFDIVDVRKAFGGVKDKVSSLSRDIEKLENERAYLVSLPLPYDDFVEWVMGRYETLGANYPRQVKSELMGRNSSLSSAYMAKREGHTTLDDFMAVFGGANCGIGFEHPLRRPGTNFIVNDEFFVYAFKDQMKAAVKRVMDEVVKPQWPKEVGSPRAERIVHLQKLEDRLGSLVEERDAIRAEFSSVLS